MKMKLIYVKVGFMAFFFLSSLTSSKSYAQNRPPAIPQEEEIEIGKGDTAVLKVPKGAMEYAFIDIYRKTRWAPNDGPNIPKSTPGYDTATGNGFYADFFEGDFDVAELPSDFKGKKLVILGVEVLKNKNTGADMNIMYLNSEIPNSVIWVDFDEAVKFNEIGFIPRKKKIK